MADVLYGIWPTTTIPRPSGASKILIKVAGDDAYYNFGAPRDVDIKVNTIGKEDSLLRMRTWGFKPEIKVPTIQASGTEIGLLPVLLLNRPVPWAITEMDGKILKDDGTKTGVRWHLRCGGKFDDFRMIDYIFGGNMSRTEIDALFTNTPITVGTPNPADKLYTITQAIVAANQRPNGLSKVEFKAVGDSDYADFGDFEDANYTFECIGPMGKGGRQIPETTAIKFVGTVKGLQTSLTEAQLMDTLVGNDLYMRFTHMDGVILTMPYTNIGATPSYLNVGNADKWRTIDMTIGGVMIVNAAGTAFETTGGTAWASLWTAP